MSRKRKERRQESARRTWKVRITAVRGGMCVVDGGEGDEWWVGRWLEFEVFF